MARTGTVVVADDDDSARKALHALLKLHDFEVVEAKNGAEAIAAALDCTPDLILMDIRMPVMDGIEATRRLRARDRTASIPIVAVSGEGFSARIAMNPEREPLFDRFLMKPVPVARLLRIVQAYADGATAHTTRDDGRGGSTTGEKAQEGASSARTPPREPRG